ncbi:MAG: HAMP domain-containing histidine kinase [Nitrospirae bacterium]|nr:HAMP domain-containing histidine kinase [Nitrospirota bacterium]
MLWGAIISATVGYLLFTSARSFYRDRGVQIARALASECARLVYYDDLAGISDLFERQMKSIPDTRYVAVLDSTGRSIWSTFPKGVPADLLAILHPAPSGEDVSTQLIRLDGEFVYDYQVVGRGFSVRLGMSQTPLRRLVGRVGRWLIGIGVAGLLAAILTAVYLSRPIEALNKAVERAVLLDERTGGKNPFEETRETSRIAQRFQELMDRLDERTRQLDAAKKLAYLGEVSATIAHEINNPLGVMTLNASFLSTRARAGQFDSGAAEEVRRLRTASKRATLATQKLLQFARYLTRKEEVRPKAVNIAVLAAECLELLEDRVRLAGCTVRVDIPPDIPAVLIDEQGIQQVLFNLLTNAVDASAEGAEVVVRATVADGSLALSVSDAGHGMTEDVLQRATEAFFSTKEHGLGVGLSISNSIVRAHGGSLALESRPGSGTTATVRLPARDVSPPVALDLPPSWEVEGAGVSEPEGSGAPPTPDT